MSSNLIKEGGRKVGLYNNKLRPATDASFPGPEEI
jgi:hypothetical protein